MIASGRHYLEKALISAIAERRGDTAINLIKTITSYSGVNTPSLIYTDTTNKRNFVSYSLELDLPNVASALLETGLFDNTDILFDNQSENQQTLVCRATANNYDNLTENILQRALKYQENAKSLDRVWTKADSLGNTPLFYSILRGNPKLMKRFIALMAGEPDRSTLSNHVNGTANTALHLIFRAEAGWDVVDQLLTFGADMGSVNIKRETPFGLLCRFDCDKQLAFAMKLSKTNQQKLVPFYKDYVVHHPDNEGMCRLYYKLSGISLGLKHLAAAHLEVDPKVKIKNAYFLKVREGAILKLMYQTIPSDLEIHRDLRNQQDFIYLYLLNNQIMMAFADDTGKIERINLYDDLRAEVYNPIKAVLQDPTREKQLVTTELAALTDIVSFHGHKLVEDKTRLVKQFISDIEDPEIVKLLPIYLRKLAERNAFGFGNNGNPTEEQLLQQDKDTLLQLINDIESYLKDLSDRKPFERYKIISVLVPVMAWAVYVGIETWLIVGAVYEGNHPAFFHNGQRMPVMDLPRLLLFNSNDIVSYFNGTWCQKYSDESYYYAYRYIDDCYTHDMNCYRARAVDWSTCNQQSIFYWSSIGFGALTGIGNLLLSCLLPYFLWSKPAPDLNISKSELRNHIEDLQQHVIAKLEKIHDSDLPINWNLQNQMADVTSKLHHDQTKQQAIALFTKLKTILTTLHDDLDKSKKPFSSALFTPVDRREVIIDIPLLDDEQSHSSNDSVSRIAESISDDEEVALLGAGHIRHFRI